MNSSRPLRELAVAIREPAPYSIVLVPEKITVEAGQKAELKVALNRYWPDFKSNVTLLPLSFPGNFQMPNSQVVAGSHEATVTIQVQANTRPGDYTLSVLGQAQVPFNKDAQATSRPNTLVSLPSRPVTITVTAAAKK
jgi:hypothetical protein